MREVGIRELKRDASAIVDAVEAGETIVITRRGKPVARLAPTGAPPGVQRLVEQGRMTWPGTPTHVPDPDPIGLAGDGPSLSEIVIEERR